MVERYPDDLEMAYSADDVERIVKAGKIASLIGIEGGVAIEDDLAQLRMFARLGARYMTLTHNTTLAWADAATDDAQARRPDPVRRAGRPRDEPAGDARRHLARLAPPRWPTSSGSPKAPIIASHSSARAIWPTTRGTSPTRSSSSCPKNGGVIMVNFYSGFIVPEAGQAVAGDPPRAAGRSTPTRPSSARPSPTTTKAHPMPRGTVKDVADHIDHIVKVAGIDHVGIGSDFDGITSCPSASRTSRATPG